MADVRQGVHSNQYVLQRMFLSHSPGAVADARHAIERNGSMADAAWQVYYPSVTELRERRAADAIVAVRRQLDELNRKALEAATRGDFDAASSILSPSYRQATSIADASIKELYAENLRQANDSYETGQSAYQRTLRISIVAVVIGLLIAAVLLV